VFKNQHHLLLVTSKFDAQQSMALLILNPKTFGIAGEIEQSNKRWRMDARVCMIKLKYGGTTTPSVTDKTVLPCTSGT
jgi:hypothetical protein